MVAGFVRVAPHGVHLAGELREDELAAGDDVGLAVACRDRRVAGAGAGLAAFEVGRAGALA